MANLATRRKNINQENAANGKAGAIIKKRGAVPLTRQALGTVTNQKASTKNAGVEQDARKPLTRQKTSTNLRSVSLKNPVVRLNKLKEEDGVAEPMEMGTPIKKEEIDQKNVFDVNDKPDVENIDEEDVGNPQLCSEFVNDIYQYMLNVEAEYPIKKHYLKETSLKSRMRTILVDWLFQVHHRFDLLQETLYLTIAILDRFLQIQPVLRTKLQLAGVTAMLIASKYEEMYAPEVNDFVYITDQAFSRSQVIQMEITMLKTLGFNLGRPLPLHFLRRNSKAGGVDANQHTLAKYLMELSVVDYEMCHVPPSKLAASALCLSVKLIGDGNWSETLQHYSMYSYEQLRPVVCHLAKNLKAAETSSYLVAIRTKYASQKSFRVSQSKEVKSSMVLKLATEAAQVAL